mgnify:CR=1 FL=1
MESIVFTQVGTFFLIMVAGVLAGRFGVIDKHANKHLSKLLIYVTMPLLLISSFQDMEYSPSDIGRLGQVLLISVTIYIVTILLGTVLYRRVEPRKRSILRFSLVFNNVGYIGFPLLDALFGTEAVFYASVYIIPFNIFLWTYGLMQFCGNRSGSYLKKAFVNPGMIAISVGIALYLLSIRLPAPILSAANMMGDMTGPLGMLIIGVLLSRSRVKDLFSGWAMYVASMLRVLVLPLAVLGVLSLFPIQELLKSVIVMLSAMPVAVNSAVFAELYDGDAHLASRTVVFSTLIAMATIPLLLYIIGP